MTLPGEGITIPADNLPESDQDPNSYNPKVYNHSGLVLDYDRIAYRLLNGLVPPITSTSEDVSRVEQVIRDATTYDGK